MKEKDLKVKEKKDTLKVLDRGGKPGRDSLLNTRLKAEFIRSVAESRNRKAEGGMSQAANDAGEEYETAAISAGSYGAGRLKGAFRQEKQKELREKSEPQENGEPEPIPFDMGDMKEKADGDLWKIQPRNEAWKGQAQKEMLQERKPYPLKAGQQGVDYQQGISRSTAAYPQSTPLYPRDNMLKKGFWKKRQKRRESKGIGQEGQHWQERHYQGIAQSKPVSSNRPVDKTAGQGEAAENRFPAYKSKAVKKLERVQKGGTRVTIRQTPKERIPAENERFPFVQKLRKKYLSENNFPQKPTAIKGYSLGKRLRQSAGRAVAAIAKDILTALGGLAGIIALFVMIGAVAALVSTAFGIFFSPFDAGDGVKSISEIVAETNQAFYAKVAGLEDKTTHDKAEYHSNGGNALFVTNWPEVVAVFAARISGDTGSALDAVTMDAEREKLLKEVFWDMNVLSADMEETEEGTVLHITHSSRSSREMADYYGFTPYQRQALVELMKPEYAQMLSELVGTLGISGGGSISLTPAQAREMLENLPENLSPERKAVMRAAYSLVGKVNYFWGGKSAAIGWDSRWGTPTKVTAAGSNMTGTTRPFGLDCSGFVTWAFINATGSLEYANIIGHGAANQYGRCKKISWSEAQPGDLVFYPDLGHVGIIAGTDSNGNLLIVHCASSQNNVVVTGLQGFTRIGRPVLFE